MNIKEYFSSLFKGAHSLIQGMEVTGKELFTKKVTEQYPENRATLEISPRFRGTLQFIYDDEGYHKCTACKTCERNCPNGTITITTKMVEQPDGKKKMQLEKYIYDLGSCTFCDLCVTSCPFHAIEFSNDFEQAVFRREALVKQLNYLPEKGNRPKPVVAKPAAAPKPAAAVEKPADAKPAADPNATQPAPTKPAAAEKPVAADPNATQPAPAKPQPSEEQTPKKED